MPASATPDLSEFLKLSKRDQRKPCRVGSVLDELSKTEAAQLEAALAQDKGIIPASAIRQWLASRNLDASITAVANHRKGGCSCGN